MTATTLDIFFSTIGFLLHLFFKVFGVNLINFLGDVWSWAAWCLFKEKRNIVKEELELIFGKRFNNIQIEDITRRSFDNYCRKQVEYLFFGDLNKDTIERMVQVQGLENLDKALSRGKGVILLLSHFGSFLLPLPFLAYHGYRVNQITGKDIHTTIFQERFWRWRKRQADRLPIKFIQVGNFLKPVYQSLKNNEIVAIAFDGRDGTTWIPVKLFDRTAIFSPGPINLSLKTKAAIIPTFIIRQNGYHRMILEPPFEMKDIGSANENLKINVERYTQIFARYLAKYPCHMGIVLQKTRFFSEKGLGNPLFQEVKT